MKINQIITETSAGATSAGSVATVSKLLGEVSKRPEVTGLRPVGTKSKKKGPYANSINEGKKVEEAKLEEEDKIIAVGKGHKLKTGLHGKDKKATALSKFVPPFKSQGLWVSDRRGNSVLEVVEHSTLASEVAAALNAFTSVSENVTPAGVIAGGMANEQQDPNEYDMEGDFVKNQIHTIVRVMTHLEKEIGDGDNLPEWVQMKISQAQGMLVGVMNYMISEKERNSEKSRGIEGITSEGAKVDRMVKHIKQSEIKSGKSADRAEDIAWATVNKRGMLDNKNKKKGK